MIPSNSRWLAYATASWALIFAAFHLAWAAGWYVGLDEDGARAAFARPWFLAYDLVVAVLCLLATVTALALVRPWGRRLPRRLPVAMVWAGAGLLALRSAASLAQTVYLIAAGRFSLRAMGVWEPWFYLGAVLFTISAWHFGRRSRFGGPVQHQTGMV